MRHLLASIGAVALAAALAFPVQAAPAPPTVCGWEGTVLWADNLPAEWSVTAEFYPTGVVPRPSSYRYDYGRTFTAYFWTRNGPGLRGAPKPGSQLNDYKIVCIAEPG